MGPRNAYKDMLYNVVSPITCISMNHQNQLEHMENGPCLLKYAYARLSFSTPSEDSSIIKTPLNNMSFYLINSVFFFTNHRDWQNGMPYISYLSLAQIHLGLA
jgi:hypothetical protein